MIYCYNDNQGYGRKLYDAVNSNRGSANMIAMAAQVPNEPESIVYINLDGTSAAEDVFYNMCDNANLIPSVRVGSMSDDCRNQHLEISKWLPSGWLIDNLRDAIGLIQKVNYPIYDFPDVNRRAIIENSDEAFKLIASKFYPKSERKEFYLRTVVESKGNEWLVFMLGKKYAFIARLNGSSFEMVNSMDEGHNELLKYVYAFMTDEDINWASVKVICGADKERKIISPFIDNVYASFPLNLIQTGGMMFESDNGLEWKSTGKPALNVFDFAAKMMIEGTI